jgi:hypothetical protein
MTPAVSDEILTRESTNPDDRLKNSFESIYRLNPYAAFAAPDDD